jgi:DNA polymerase theta
MSQLLSNEMSFHTNVELSTDEILPGTQHFMDFCEKVGNDLMNTAMIDDENLIGENGVNNVETMRDNTPANLLHENNSLHEALVDSSDIVTGLLDDDLVLDESVINELFRENCSEINADERILCTQDLVQGLHEDFDFDDNNEPTKQNSSFANNNMSRANTCLINGELQPFVHSTTQDEYGLSHWEIPADIKEVYDSNGVTSLYPWQVCCLQQNEVTRGRGNLVYCAPTSGGKTMVVEVLMIRELMKQTQKQKIIFIVPYVSIVEEKADYLSKILQPHEFLVAAYHGSSAARPQSNFFEEEEHVAVCTFEKANSIINLMIENGRLDELSMVIVDELHMITDIHRGYLLELLLTKLLYMNTRHIQIIGMSATLPNVEDVAEWLSASLFITNYRPVPLTEFVLYNNTVYSNNRQKLRSIVNKNAKYDKDGIVPLCEEVVQDGASVLIFCSSKYGTEICAEMIANLIQAPDPSPFVVEGRNVLVNKLRRTVCGLDPRLEHSINKGVAFHHAGLTVDERKEIEAAFREGLINVLTCTTTLSTGVNLPARRVIFRDMKIAHDIIEVGKYRQASGRAGRTGHDLYGESFLIARNQQEYQRAFELMNSKLAEIKSCLADLNCFSKALVEVIASGVVESASDILRYVQCTLLSSQYPAATVTEWVKGSLNALQQNEFISWNKRNQKYIVTAKGKACFYSNLSPNESQIVFKNLEKAKKGLILETELHTVFLLTPISTHINIDWQKFQRIYEQHASVTKPVARAIGIEEELKTKFYFATGRGETKRSGPEYCPFRHFFASLILYIIISEEPVFNVAETFGITRGELQQLQSSASMYASMITTFAHHLRWSAFRNIFKEFADRLSYGVQNDIIALVQIPLVTAFRARALYNAGYNCINSIAQANPEDLEQHLTKVQPFQSKLCQVDESNIKYIRGIELRLAKQIVQGAKAIMTKARRYGGIDREWLYGQDAASGADARGSPGTPSKSKVKSSQLPRKSITGKLQKYSQHYRKDSFSQPSQSRTNLPNERTHKHVSPPRLVSAQKRLFSTPSSETVNGEGKRLRLSPDHAEQPICTVRPPMQPRAPRVIAPPQFTRLSSKFKFDIVSVNSNQEFDYFVDEILAKQKQIVFRLHTGITPMKTSSPSSKNHLVSKIRTTTIIMGVSFCWPTKMLRTQPKEKNGDTSEDNPTLASTIKEVYYVNIDDNHYKSERYKYRVNKLKPIFESEHVEKITFSAKEQIVDLLHHGFINIPPHTILDGKIAAWIKNPTEDVKEMTLEEICKKDLSSVYDNYASAASTHIEMQCKMTWQSLLLMAHMLPLLDQAKLMVPFRNSETPMISVLAEMEYIGFGFDPNVIESYKPLVDNKMKELKEETVEEAGQDFDIKSPQDTARILYDVLKYNGVTTKNSSKKNPQTTTRSTKDEVLQQLRDRYPEDKICGMISLYRSLQSAMSKQILPFLRQNAVYDPSNDCCRVFTKHLQTTSVTGRIMTTSPNLQNTPKPIKFVRANLNMSEQMKSQIPEVELNTRSAFVPAKGYMLLSVDYSSIEVRFIAHFSRDENLIRLLSDPTADIFRQIAAHMFEKPESDVLETDRSAVKEVIYGILYGMGQGTLGDKLHHHNPHKHEDRGIDRTEEAKRYKEQFLNRFPMVRQYREQVRQFVQKHEYVKTLFDRRRYVPEMKSKKPEEQNSGFRKALNAICQGSAADLMKFAMIHIRNELRELDRKLYPSSAQSTMYPKLGQCARLMLSVHDELIFEVHKEHLIEVSRLVRRCMEGAGSQLRVPFPVKMRIGESWGSLSVWDLESS